MRTSQTSTRSPRTGTSVCYMLKRSHSTLPRHAVANLYPFVPAPASHGVCKSREILHWRMCNQKALAVSSDSAVIGRRSAAQASETIRPGCATTRVSAAKLPLLSLLPLTAPGNAKATRGIIMQVLLRPYVLLASSSFSYSLHHSAGCCS